MYARVYVCLSVSVSSYVSVCLSLTLSPSVFLSAPVFLSVSLSPCLPLSFHCFFRSVYLYVYMSPCLSVSLSLSSLTIIASDIPVSAKLTSGPNDRHIYKGKDEIKDNGTDGRT